MPKVDKAESVYVAADAFRARCLEKDDSLLFEGETVWTVGNLKVLKEHFNDDPDITKRNFLEKFKEQLADLDAPVVRLAVDVLAVYSLFSSSVSGRTKRAQLELVASWKDLEIASPLMSCFDRGIGGTGQSFNQRKPEELWFVIDFALAWKEVDDDAVRTAMLKDAEKFRSFMDTIDGADRRQMRHALLHLLFPDHFEPIASGGHKWRIATAFDSLVAEPEEEQDALLRQIRVELQKYVAPNPFHYYRDPVRMAWNLADDEGYTATDALLYKKQVILYGPPGTGKTHWAKERAARLVRSEALGLKGAEWYFKNETAVAELAKARVHRVQLHPGYSYEDFIRGLHIGAEGRTEYRAGYLLELVRRISSDESEFKALPHVLILDEINRTDLSRLLGECFSLLEDRENFIELPGLDGAKNPLRLELPANLFVIGTMNLIDQSLEQIDFALRRRFFWVEHAFDEDALLDVCRAKWDAVDRKPHTWERVGPEFEVLAGAAVALNDAIRASRFLGPAFEIGHTYFFDVVQFLDHDLRGVGRNRKYYLWSPKEPRAAVANLWRLSLEPLLREYLRGLEERERQTELTQLKKTFLEQSPAA